MMKITTMTPMTAPTITPVLLDEPESPEEFGVEIVSPDNPESSSEGIMVEVVVGIAVVPVGATMQRRKKITIL